MNQNQNEQIEINSIISLNADKFELVGKVTNWEELFLNKENFRQVLIDAQKIGRGLVADPTTKEGCIQIKTMAKKISTLRNLIEEKGKEIAAELKAKPKLIDATRKEVKDTLDKLKGGGTRLVPPGQPFEGASSRFGVEPTDDVLRRGQPARVDTDCMGSATSTTQLFTQCVVDRPVVAEQGDGEYLSTSYGCGDRVGAVGHPTSSPVARVVWRERPVSSDVPTGLGAKQVHRNGLGSDCRLWFPYGAQSEI